MCAAALFLDQLKKLFEAHKLLVSKKESEAFQRLPKYSQKKFERQVKIQKRKK